MEFNSIEFLSFLAFLFFLLWGLKDHAKVYNVILLIASYTFYGLWDYRFLFLIFASSVVDFVIGYYIPQSKYKKLLITTSLALNLGLLMFFKYFNFFIETTNDFLQALGFENSYHTLSIILPVGISFYTFQTLSYSLDIYKGKIKPTKDFLVFLNFVSFFPQLVAGPIERAARFLPQFTEKKKFNIEEATIGMRLLLYGLFKKIVIADNAAIRIDPVFANPEGYTSTELSLAAFYFSIQLYTDFSAYTDIARGVGKLLGFRLMENFKNPLFSQSVPEFWSRWHISLTTWFRDYLFIWLAGLNRKSTVWRIIATIILFVVIGFWHGANYTFIVFGFLNGLYFIPKILSGNYKWLRDSLNYIKQHTVWGYVIIVANLGLLTLTGIIFRSATLSSAGLYFERLFFASSYTSSTFMVEFLPAGLAFLAFEWVMRKKSHPFDISSFHPMFRRSLYVLLIITTLLYGYFGTEPFYYFQF